MLSIDLRILIHTVLYKNTAKYLTDLPHLQTSIRPIRNPNSKILMLLIPNINRKQHGGGALRYMAASTWNNVPNDIRKSSLYRRSDTLKYYLKYYVTCIYLTYIL